ncbi:hypothetical protein IST461_05546 [Burkholderia multivorans]|nr:hypothetical protein IST495A_04072 [Burkholderia multivorans]CAB5341877.1 hypothetical protein IST461_05546 [Burkholderia multivorans]
MLRWPRALFQALLEAVFKRMVERSRTCKCPLKQQDSLITPAQARGETGCIGMRPFEAGSPVHNRFG